MLNSNIPQMNQVRKTREVLGRNYLEIIRYVAKGHIAMHTMLF